MSHLTRCALCALVTAVLGCSSSSVSEQETPLGMAGSPGQSAGGTGAAPPSPGGGGQPGSGGAGESGGAGAPASGGSETGGAPSGGAASNGGADAEGGSGGDEMPGDGGTGGEAAEGGSGGMPDDGGPAENECDTSNFQEPSSFDEVLRIPLLVHTTRSKLPRDEFCEILAEVNQIWLAQAGICFEMEITAADAPRNFGLDIWWEATTPFPNGVTANGVHAGPHAMYTKDEPGLGRAPNPVEWLSARTAAHELGHCLSLRHQNCGQDCDDLLMTSGKRGYGLITGNPANTNEVDDARATAQRERGGQTLALPETDLPRCSRPKFID